MGFGGGGGFEQAGLEAVIRGMGAYTRDAGRIQGANKGIFNSLTSVQKASAGFGTALVTAAAAGGAAGVVLAANFEESMAQIAALTDVPKAALDDLKDSILDTSRELGKSPEELGSAAYFILSSGITDVDTALKVMTKSAKASVAGLGDTTTIARTATGIMNAFGLGIEDVDAFFDQFVQTVKSGAGAPEELAQSIGRVAPIAAQLGIPFADLGAIFAALTNNGLGAEESVTALLGILNQLASPTDQAREVFAKLNEVAGGGLGSFESFRKELGDNFIPAMTELFALFGDNTDIAGKLFPEIRGLTGGFSAFGKTAEQTAEISERVTQSQGALEESFRIMENTVNHRLAVAINNLKVDLIEFGSEALPLVVQALDDLGRAAGIAGDNLDVLALAAIGIAVAFAWATPGGALAVGLAAIIGLIILLRTENDALGTSALNTKIQILSLIDTFSILINALLTAADVLANFNGLLVFMGEQGADIPVLGGLFSGLGKTFGIFGNSVDGAKESMSGVDQALDEARASLAQFRTDQAIRELQELASQAFTTAGALTFLAELKATPVDQINVFQRQKLIFQAALAKEPAQIPTEFDLPSGADVSGLLDDSAAELEKINPFQFFVDQERIQDIIREAAETGQIAWSDVAQLWELGAHEAAEDFAAFLRGEVSAIGDDIGESFRAIAEKWMTDVERGILDGTLDVLDALDFLENGMIDAAQSIVAGLAQQASDIGEQWQILVDILKRGTVEISDVNRLFDLNATDAALDLLRFLAGEDSNIGEAIIKSRRAGRGGAFRGGGGASFQHGGFVPPGQTIGATLHGGSQGEIIVPLGSSQMMMTLMSKLLGSIGGGMGGGSFRNYGTISVGGPQGAPVERALLRALGA